MRSNLIRKSYFFNKLLFRSSTRLINLVKKPYRRKKKFNSCTTNSLFISMRPNNTFITITGEVKLHNITAGISGFKGPKRSTPYSRHVVAKNMSYYMFRNKIVNDPCDLYFNSMISKKFFFFFKGLIFKPINVRYIIRNKMVSHGFLRKKKKRRK